MTSDDVEIDETDRAEQAASVDPDDVETAPEGGPDLVDEADWLDQQTDAPQDDPEA